MDIEIYTRDGCSYCDMVKKIFTAKGWAYSERKLLKDFQREEFKNMFGSDATFPRVMIEGKIIGGANETVNYLRENNLI
jgi:glutaredoxin 3